MKQLEQRLLRIMELRRARRMSQERLAVEVGLTPAQISMVETGKRHPRTPELLALARVLRVDLDGLLVESIRRSLRARRVEVSPELPAPTGEELTAGLLSGP